MSIREAIKAIYCQGKKVKLPEWKGWWYLGEDGLIWVHAQTGENEFSELETPWFSEYSNRNDWEIIEDD